MLAKLLFLFAVLAFVAAMPTQLQGYNNGYNNGYGWNGYGGYSGYSGYSPLSYGYGSYGSNGYPYNLGYGNW